MSSMDTFQEKWITKQMFDNPFSWKVSMELMMEPPIQAKYFLSGGATILVFIVGGARAVISFSILSAIPGNIKLPPDSTVLAYKSFLRSTSHFMMELNTVSWIPADSLSIN